MRRAEGTRSDRTPPVNLPEGIIDSIQDDILLLSAPGGRRVGSPGHDAAVDILLRRMAEEGLEPLAGEGFGLPHDVVHPSTGESARIVDLAGILRGGDPGARPIIVGAHYDSAIDAPCSDDNAASVAVILSAAGLLARQRLARDLVIVFFDAEERPFFGTDSMGSELFCRHHLSGMGPALAIVLDVIGHAFSSGLPLLDRMIPGIGELFFITGSESASSLPGIVRSAAEEVPSMRVVPTLSQYVGNVSDDGAFRRNGMPCLFLSAGPAEYHHTKRDVPSRISRTRLGSVLHLLAGLLISADAAPPGRDEGPCDPVEFEVEMLRRAVGWPLHPLLFALGSAYPRSRRDLDDIAELLRGVIGVTIGGSGQG